MTADVKRELVLAPKRATVQYLCHAVTVAVTRSRRLERPERRRAAETQRRRSFPRRTRHHGIAALPRLARWPQGLGHRDRHVVGEPGHDLDRFARYLVSLAYVVLRNG